MIENKTASILQRVPRILAVTAASYGLAQRPGSQTVPGNGQPNAASAAGQSKPH